MATPGLIALRPYISTDGPELVAVYRDAVRSIGAQFYQARQIEVWSAYPESLADFDERLSRGVTLVATDAARPVAFGQLDPADHVAFLYCRGSHSRYGLATRIYRELERHAALANQPHLTTDASRVSRPFFEKQGFAMIAREEVERHGVLFERFKMRKTPLETARP